MQSEDRQGTFSVRKPAMERALRAPVPAPCVKRLGLVEFRPTYAAMREFTTSRREDTPDELWVLQHSPVYTTGLACRPEHLPRASAIPVERVDRGGQITYHLSLIHI